MRLTLCYITGRRDPHLDWALDDLISQRREGDRISLVVIDFYGRGQHELGIRIGHRLEHIIISRPKPTIWQGEHRITRDHWWAKSNACNTALALAPTDYVAFLDDRCHLSPTYLDAVRRGYHERQSVMFGSYQKLEDHHAGRDDVIGRDSRLDWIQQQGRHELIGCPGGWLYGSVWAAPLQWALDVNGFEEALDGLSFEDCIFGMMLENAGKRCDYVPSMGVIQDRRGGVTDAHANAFKRTDKGPEPKRIDGRAVHPMDKSNAALERFGKARRTDSGYTPDLQSLRNRLTAGGDFLPVDKSRDWRDWYDCPCGCSPLVRDQMMHSFVQPVPAEGPKPRMVDPVLDSADGAKQEGMPWR